MPSSIETQGNNERNKVTFQYLCSKINTSLTTSISISDLVRKALHNAVCVPRLQNKRPKQIVSHTPFPFNQNYLRVEIKPRIRDFPHPLTSFFEATVVLWLVGWWPRMIFSTFNLWPKSAKLCSRSNTFLFVGVSGDCGTWWRLGEETARRYCEGVRVCGKSVSSKYLLLLTSWLHFCSTDFNNRSSVLSLFSAKVGVQ